MSTIPADLAGAESFEGEIIAESADYTAYELLDPGTYLSASRKVSAGQAVDKNERAYILALIEVSELQNENGETIVLNRPLLGHPSSRTWAERGAGAAEERP